MARLNSAVAFAVLVLATACSQYKPFDSVAHLRGEVAPRLGAARAASLDVPFALSPELTAAAQTVMRPAGAEREKVTHVIDFIFDDLHLQYSVAPTRTAASTYATRRGNCLSFVNLFVALAREQGLAPFYVEVTDYQKWSNRDGMVVSQGHIVGGMYLDGELKTYDFLPYRPKAYRKFNPIDDLAAVAHYYNNLGAEALLAGDNATARGLLETAVAIAPSFDRAYNNLGVAQARAGEVEPALATYRKGLEKAPDNTMIMTNMARLFQRQGRGKEADELLAKVDASNTTNPFFFVYEGEIALSHGDTEKALDYMTKALRQDSEVPEVHLGFVKVYLALGELDKARHFLDRALKLDATQAEALRYAKLLLKKQAG